MSFPRYPKYKDSGVEWLGEVPEHWQVRRLGQIGPLLKGSGGSKEDIVESGVPCVRYGDLYTTHAYFIRQARTHVSEERAADYFPIQKGDVLFAASGEDLAEIGRSAVVLIHERVFCGGDLVILRPQVSVAPEFMGYACDCWVSKAQKASMGRGTTVKHIYPDELKRLLLALPPLPEQGVIAAFLDRETAKIDALIAEQQRLIELLQEKRQAVISHAVTKGLNSDVPMKDSKIEWLGEVPEHWEVGPLKRFGTSLDGRRIPLSTEERSYRQGNYPYYGASGVIDSVDNYLFDEDLVLVSEDGANLLNRSSPIAFVATGRYWVNNHAHIFRPIDGNLHYWAERIEAVDLTPFVSGSAQPKFTAEALLNLRIAVPSSDTERRAIQDHFIGETRVVAELIAQAEQAVILLRERRSALISAAVTGQIDVRRFSSGGSEAA